MEESKFTAEQMVSILRESDTRGVVETARKYGISDQTIYLWRRNPRGMEAADVKKLRELETENAPQETGCGAGLGNRGHDGDRRKKW